MSADTVRRTLGPTAAALGLGLCAYGDRLCCLGWGAGLDPWSGACVVAVGANPVTPCLSEPHLSFPGNGLPQAPSLDLPTRAL